LADELLFKRSEAARRLNVTPNTIKRWQQDGRIGLRRVGQLAMVPASDVYRLAEDGLPALEHAS